MSANNDILLRNHQRFDPLRGANSIEEIADLLLTINCCLPRMRGELLRGDPFKRKQRLRLGVLVICSVSAILHDFSSSSCIRHSKTLVLFQECISHQCIEGLGKVVLHMRELITQGPTLRVRKSRGIHESAQLFKSHLHLLKTFQFSIQIFCLVSKLRPFRIHPFQGLGHRVTPFHCPLLWSLDKRVRAKYAKLREHSSVFFQTFINGGRRGCRMSILVLQQLSAHNGEFCWSLYAESDVPPTIFPS